MRRATVIGSSSPSPAPCRRRKLAATQTRAPRPPLNRPRRRCRVAYQPSIAAPESPLKSPAHRSTRQALAKLPCWLAFAPSKFSAQHEPGIWLEYGASDRGRDRRLDLQRLFGARPRALTLLRRREKFDRFQLTSLRGGAYIPAIGVAVRSRRDGAPHQAPHWYSEKGIRQLSGARSCDGLAVCRRVGASRSRAV